MSIKYISLDCAWRYLRVNNIFLKLSIYCSVASLSLVSFDECPWVVAWVFPHRPSYFISMAGLLFFLFSGVFVPAATKMLKLIVPILIIIIWGGVGTIVGSLNHCPGDFCTFFIYMYTTWRVIPFVFMVWFAMLFSVLPVDISKKYFSLGLLLLFSGNAVHMFLEVIANLGVGDVKNFLISINNYFRFAEIGHGWWPPVYYEGRVRGFFAEPSHMTSSLFVLFGLFMFKAKENKTYYLLALLLSVFFIASKSHTGLICMAFFVAMLCIDFVRKYLKSINVLRFSLPLFFVAMIAVSISLFTKSNIFYSAVAQYENAKLISEYCTAYYQDKSTAIPLIMLGDEKVNAFNRMTSFLLDIDIAKLYPLGIGYVQRGFYWTCLQSLDTSKFEIGLWVKQSEDDTYKGVPQLSEFGSLMAEEGFLGLILFLLIYGYIALSGYFFSVKNNDSFVLCMTYVYICMSLSLFFVPLANFFIFYYLSGFLYGICLSNKQPFGNRSRG